MTRVRALALAVAAWTLSGCGSGAGRPVTLKVETVTPSTETTATAPAAARPRPKPKPAPAPGKLPQTHQLPSSDTAAFHSEMAALWNGVRLGSVGAALPAFFPEAAYEQVKAIADPAADWRQRLVGGYALDLSAAHALLGQNPGGAQLVRVIVPAGYVHWVDPGACYNRVGYYEVPNSRVVYRQGGEVRSFGIASMISWRGVWYVVHLGAVVGGPGVVDDPSTGEGVSAPSSTC